MKSGKSVFVIAICFIAAVVIFSCSIKNAEARPRGGRAFEGPRGGEAVEGPGGNAAVQGPRGNVAVGTQYASSARICEDLSLWVIEPIT